MLHFLANLEGAGVLTACFPPGLDAAAVEERLIGTVPDGALDHTVQAVCSSKTGAVILWGEPHRCLVIPPFPFEHLVTWQGYHGEVLQGLLESPRRIALIVVRLGEFGIGVFEGEKRLGGKAGTGLVHARHKKGGSSQGRFRRHREKQMEAFFDRVCRHVQEQLGPYVSGLDHVAYGGEVTTLNAFRKRCRSLDRFDDRRLDKRLDVRNPRQDALQKAIADLWSCDLLEWVETG